MEFIIFFFCSLQAAATCYIELIVKESDNNVKLIVLDRLIQLKEHPSHEKVDTNNCVLCDPHSDKLNVYEL